MNTHTLVWGEALLRNARNLHFSSSSSTGRPAPFAPHMSDEAATANERVHEFMDYRRALRLRMGEASGAGELALMTKLLGSLRANPEHADADLRSALHFTPVVLELKAQASFWATFEMKDRSLALAQSALRPQCVAEHEVVSSHALVVAASTRILQRHGGFALKPVIGELGGGVLTVRAWDARSNRPMPTTTSNLSCDSPLAHFHLYTPTRISGRGWFRASTAALGRHKHGEALAEEERAEPLHMTLERWVQDASQGLTSDAFTTETAQGERWLVEQLTPTLEGFGPFELRVFVLGSVATCAIFDELEDADEPLAWQTWRDYRRDGAWGATSWSPPECHSPSETTSRTRRFVDSLQRAFLADLARDAEALAKAAGACLLFRADFFVFPTGLDGGSSWQLDEYAAMAHGTDLRSAFSYRLNEVQYWLGNLVSDLETPHFTFVLEALKALLAEFEEHKEEETAERFRAWCRRRAADED